MPAPAALLKGFARTVANLKPHPTKRITEFDPDTRGLCVRVTPKGGKSYTIVARNPDGKQVWAIVGDVDGMTLEDARTKAREGVQRIKAGLDPFPKLEAAPAPDPVKTVVENFLKRHVNASGLRSAGEIERQFNAYVLPAWQDRAFASIRRGDVAKLLDDVEDNNGPVMADRVLATLSKLFNWYAARNDDYSSPIVRGMARTKPRERARKRILSDDEIRVIWPAASGTFGALVKVALLTGQRREKVAAMKWSDIADDGTWTIPAEKREKANAGSLQLPDLALSIVRAQPTIAGNPYVFAGRGKTHIAGFSALKRALDAKVLKAMREAAAERGDDPETVEPLDGWTLHDLRRTAKSLMARAGVRPDIGERVLGHVIPGVEGIYDRHSYDDEKADALAKLAALVERILNPPADNVREFRSAAR